MLLMVARVHCWHVGLSRGADNRETNESELRDGKGKERTKVTVENARKME